MPLPFFHGRARQNSARRLPARGPAGRCPRDPVDADALQRLNVEQMAGRITVESSVGSGARFIVDLPLSKRAPAPAAAAEPTQGRRGNETILLVEDEPAVRDFCKRALESEGYRVVAGGPKEALSLASALGSDLDLLVTDVVMPDLDGPAIAAALAKAHASLKVLFMSGYPRDREKELTGPAIGVSVLEKPFSSRELGEAVRPSPRSTGRD